MPAAPRSTTISGVRRRPGRRASSRLRCASSFEPIQERGAFAVRFVGKLLWDNVKGEISNNREANKLVRPLFRKGWEIKL
jgi:hypothetical protein